MVGIRASRRFVSHPPSHGFIWQHVCGTDFIVIFTRAATAPMIDFLESIVSRSLSQSSLFASAKSGAVGCLERNCACDAFDPEAPPGDASSILCVHPLDCRRICDELTNCTAFEACAERNRRLPRLVSCSVAFVSFCGTIIPINLRDAHLVCVTRA